MTDESPKRFDRIIAILIQLQSKRIVKAQELADRFQVSLRTIYRDIKTLEASGVPIAGEAGTGYSVMEGYKLPPVMFSHEEATSFVAAEKLMRKFVDKSLGDSFQSAVYKVKSVLRWNEKDLVDNLDAQIHVQSSHPLFNEAVPNALEILMNGIVNKQQVRVTYHSLESETPLERTIEPIGLYHEYSYWYMIAYCHLRKDYRKFRTDRIYKIAALQTPFAIQHRDLSFYLNEEKPEQEKKLIRILIDKKIARWLKGSKKVYGFVSETEKGDVTEMCFLYGDKEEHFARWYLMFGDSATILEPESLKEKVSELIQKIQVHLQ